MRLDARYQNVRAALRIGQRLREKPARVEVMGATERGGQRASLSASRGAWIGGGASAHATKREGAGPLGQRCARAQAAAHLLMSSAVRPAPPTPMLSVSLPSGFLPACSHTSAHATPTSRTRL